MFLNFGVRYYMLELNKIHNLDCMNGMGGFPDKYFDLAIVDPPYGIGAGREKPHNGWKDWGIKDWDLKRPDKKYFDELFRVSKNQIVWGGNYYTDYTQPSMGWIIWDKGQRGFSLADGEMAWTSFDRAVRIFTCARGKALKDNKIHPTQKPLQLYKWTLKKYAKEGWKILDTHGGSGTLAVACEWLGFDYCVFEIDKEYWEGANARLEKERKKMRQTSLFGEMQV